MRSVSGGGHWGGGLFVSTADLLRRGEFLAADGEWSGKRLLSGEWFQRMMSPTLVDPIVSAATRPVFRRVG
jgi:CubicO group peptidase (beta-lactamase class C family)